MFTQSYSHVIVDLLPIMEIDTLVDVVLSIVNLGVNNGCEFTVISNVRKKSCVNELLTNSLSNNNILCVVTL